MRMRVLFNDHSCLLNKGTPSDRANRSTSYVCLLKGTDVGCFIREVVLETRTGVNVLVSCEAEERCSGMQPVVHVLVISKKVAVDEGLMNYE